MALRIFNSLSRRKEEFQPLEPGRAGLYACGPTVYDLPHLGHLRSAHAFETVRRWLRFCGYRVRFVRNVTDVDDKIIEKARSAGAADLNAETSSVARRYLEAYRKDLKRLGIDPPDAEPLATEHVAEMIALTRRLLKNGHAYESGGDVYFEVSRFERYGRLSGQKKDSMLEGARVEPLGQKKDPLDFALWKRAKEGEPSWESPWGRGRPGWHVECSAMSMKHLGETFDLHGGGRDLIFPHHENEIAQSEAATGRPFARIWIHHGLVTVNEQKMSKSLGNFITLDDVERSWSVDELKLLFAGTHYSAPLDYSEDKMKMERAVWRRFYHFFHEVRQLADEGFGPSPGARVDRHFDAFREAMDDDFNTPQAMACLHEVMHECRRSGDPGVLLYGGAKIAEWGGAVLGLFAGWDTAPVFERLAGGRDAALEERLADRIRARAQAKSRKDYAAADAIRAELASEEIELVDLAGGRTIWRRRL